MMTDNGYIEVSNGELKGKIIHDLRERIGSEDVRHFLYDQMLGWSSSLYILNDMYDFTLNSMLDNFISNGDDEEITLENVDYFLDMYVGEYVKK